MRFKSFENFDNDHLTLKREMGSFDLILKDAKKDYSKAVSKHLKRAFAKFEMSFEFVDTKYNKNGEAEYFYIIVDDIPMILNYSGQIMFDKDKISKTFLDKVLLGITVMSFSDIEELKEFLERKNAKLYSNKKLDSLFDKTGILEARTEDEIKYGHLKSLFEESVQESKQIYVNKVINELKKFNLETEVNSKIDSDFTNIARIFINGIPMRLHADEFKFDLDYMKENMKDLYHHLFKKFQRTSGPDFSNIKWMLEYFEEDDFLKFYINKKTKPMTRIGIFENVDNATKRVFALLNSDAKKEAKINYLNKVIAEFKKHNLECVENKKADTNITDIFGIFVNDIPMLLREDEIIFDMRYIHDNMPELFKHLAKEFYSTHGPSYINVENFINFCKNDQYLQFYINNKTKPMTRLGIFENKKSLITFYDLEHLSEAKKYEEYQRLVIEEFAKYNFKCEFLEKTFTGETKKISDMKMPILVKKDDVELPMELEGNWLSLDDKKAPIVIPEIWENVKHGQWDKVANFASYYYNILQFLGNKKLKPAADIGIFESVAEKSTMFRDFDKLSEAGKVKMYKKLVIEAFKNFNIECEFLNDVAELRDSQLQLKVNGLPMIIRYNYIDFSYPELKELSEELYNLTRRIDPIDDGFSSIKSFMRYYNKHNINLYLNKKLEAPMKYGVFEKIKKFKNFANS